MEKRKQNREYNHLITFNSNAWLTKRYQPGTGLIVVWYAVYTPTSRLILPLFPTIRL